MNSYGKELILDIHGCTKTFDRCDIRKFMRLLCKKLGMKRARLHIWGYSSEQEREEAPAHLAGISAVQFITTSNITIHTLDKLETIYINIFTCKDLNPIETARFCQDYWKGHIVKSTFLERA